MDYKDELKSIIDTYYKDILEEYKVTTTAATKDGKKLGLFRKVKYEGHIAGFEKHGADAKVLISRAEAVKVPEDDENGQDLKAKLEQSLDDFVELCDRNVEYYRIMDKKQRAGSGVTVDDFKLALAGANSGMITSVNSLRDLDLSLKVFNGELSAEELAALNDKEEQDGYEDEIPDEDKSYINLYDEDDEENDGVAEEASMKPNLYRKQEFEDDEE